MCQVVEVSSCVSGGKSPVVCQVVEVSSCVSGGRSLQLCVR